ncbi:basic amino acid ABC transporter substrate-binding protein [Neobacillus dielmonensis]|uniref:basic amino acid ABC transporter substrate-binding protein n=1 Tax=Neobacillus dielmonensis TaxID=1347369 RepID=UPI0005AA61AE|nr:basic amino acid ABC transporter substrate-binding protein [Neobacillus dielmonensis]
MKRSKLMVVISVVFLLLLSACGTSKTGGDGDKKTLRIVTDAAYAPFEYQDKGEVVGFDVDFVKAVAKEAGYEAKVEHVGWDPVFVEIEGKTADAAVSAITITDKRKKSYDFSVPYFLSTNKIMVPKDSPIKSAADLKDKVVAVQNGTTGMTATEKLLGAENKNLKKFKDNNLAIMELKGGGADAVVADNTVIEEYVKNNPKENFVVIEDPVFEKEFYGVLFPKDSKLKAEFDKAIKKLMENGEYAKIYNKWFKVDPDLTEINAQQ